MGTATMGNKIKTTATIDTLDYLNVISPSIELLSK
jgi:hypothetical protein